MRQVNLIPRYGYASNPSRPVEVGQRFVGCDKGRDAGRQRRSRLGKADCCSRDGDNRDTSGCYGEVATG